MGSNINFIDYLKKNENWLMVEASDAGGNHKKDGTITNEELTTFLSGAHLQSSGSEDTFISREEFNKWYDANESAITGFLKDDGSGGEDKDKYSNLDYNAQSTKDAFFKSIQELTTQNSNYNSSTLTGQRAVVTGKDENGENVYKEGVVKLSSGSNMAFEDLHGKQPTIRNVDGSTTDRTYDNGNLTESITKKNNRVIEEQHNTIENGKITREEKTTYNTAGKTDTKNITKYYPDSSKTVDNTKYLYSDDGITLRNQYSTYDVNGKLSTDKYKITIPNGKTCEADTNWRFLLPPGVTEAGRQYYENALYDPSGTLTSQAFWNSNISNFGKLAIVKDTAVNGTIDLTTDRKVIDTIQQNCRKTYENILNTATCAETAENLETYRNDLVLNGESLFGPSLPKSSMASAQRSFAINNGRDEVSALKQLYKNIRTRYGTDSAKIQEEFSKLQQLEHFSFNYMDTLETINGDSMANVDLSKYYYGEGGLWPTWQRAYNVKNPATEYIDLAYIKSETANTKVDNQTQLNTYFNSHYGNADDTYAIHAVLKDNNLTNNEKRYMIVSLMGLSDTKQIVDAYVNSTGSDGTKKYKMNTENTFNTLLQVLAGI